MPKLPFVDFTVQNPLSSPITLNNDQNTPLTIVTLDSTSIKSAILEYSITRSTTTEAGRMFISTDGTTLGLEVDKGNNDDTGITFIGTLSGFNILIQYLSTNTGQTAVFRYLTRTLN